MRYQLTILWRSKGEAVLNFLTRKEAEKHMHLLESEAGQQIVKMELVEK